MKIELVAGSSSDNNRIIGKTGVIKEELDDVFNMCYVCFVCFYGLRRMQKGKGMIMGCFDENPDDGYENAPCDLCGGEVRLNEGKTWWECKECNFKIAAMNAADKENLLTDGEGSEMEAEVIKNQLVKYNVTDVKIAEISSQYLSLKIKDINDKVGRKAISVARIDVKKLIAQVENTRRELKADSLAYGRAVDAEAHRIEGLLLPVKLHLEGEEDRIEHELLSIKSAMLNKRLDIIGSLYPHTRDTWRIIVENQTDIEFERQLESALIVHGAELKRLAETEKLKQAEVENQKRIKEEQDAIFKQQFEERERLALEQIRLTKLRDEGLEKIRLEAETIRKREDELAAKELAAKQKLEFDEKSAKDKILAEKKAANDKIETEKRIDLEAKRKSALLPDREKLIEYAIALSKVPEPSVSKPEAKARLKQSKEMLNKTCEFLRKEI